MIFIHGSKTINYYHCEHNILSFLSILLILSDSTLSEAFHLFPPPNSNNHSNTSNTSALTMNTNTNTKSGTRSKRLTQFSYRGRLNPESKIQSHDVASLPRPGTSSPTCIRVQTTTTTTSKKEEEENESWVTYLLPSNPTLLTC